MNKIWDGSARKLVGDCLMLCVFVSSDESWDDSDKQKTLKGALRAAKWLEEQAAEYDIEANFIIKCANKEEDIYIENFPPFNSSHNEKVIALQDVVKQFEYKSLTHFYNDIEKHYPEHNIHVLFFINSVGRSYMTSFYINDEDQFVEVNVVFKGSDTQNITDWVIVHETLHAYGAYDLYNDNVATIPEAKKAMDYVKKHFPNEVMCVHSKNLDETELSEFTAFLIGWHEEPEKWYFDMVQPAHRKNLEFAMKNFENFDENGNFIVEEEEINANFYNNAREFNRYIVNENEDLIIWREHIYETEEELEYLETGNDENYYYLTPQTEGVKITIPKKGGGSCYKLNSETNKYEIWCKVTKGSIEDAE